MQDMVAHRDIASQTQHLLETKLRHIKKVALAAALVPLAAAVPAQAFEVAHSSRVDSTVQAQGSEYRYEFTVVNTTPGFSGAGGPIIVNWELPLFDLADVSNIESPIGWSYEIIAPDQSTTYYNNATGHYGHYWWNWSASSDPSLDPSRGGDLDAYGPNPDMFVSPPLIIHWYTTHTVDGLNRVVPDNPILTGGFQNAFAFVSEYSPANAPYLSSWYELPPVPGDPPIPGNAGFLPGSPSYYAAVPEPGSIAGLGMGMAALFPLLRRRAKLD